MSCDPEFELWCCCTLYNELFLCSFLLQEAATSRKRVSALGLMFPMQTGQWVLMTLIGPWVVDQHQAGKQDHQLIIQLEHLLVSFHDKLIF